jgi:hypothetical protein
MPAPCRQRYTKQTLVQPLEPIEGISARGKQDNLSRAKEIIHARRDMEGDDTRLVNSSPKQYQPRSLGASVTVQLQSTYIELLLGIRRIQRSRTNVSGVHCRRTHFPITLFHARCGEAFTFACHYHYPRGYIRLARFFTGARKQSSRSPKSFCGLVHACPCVHVCGWLWLQKPPLAVNLHLDAQGLYCIKSTPRGLAPWRSRTQKSRIGQVESPGRYGILRRQS